MLKKKLIEVALPLAAINAASAREKSIRHGHPSTLHLWWARRPLASARAVLFAQLVDDPSARSDEFPTVAEQDAERQRLFALMEQLVVWENSNDEKILAAARAEILKSCDGELPKVLDPFGGGGAIPLESLRLGLPTYTGDLNPVAVMIQRAMLEIPQRFTGRRPVFPGLDDDLGSMKTFSRAQGLAADVQAYGEWMRDEAQKRIGHLYPDAVLPDGSTATPIAWIWARTVESPDPAWKGHVPLVRSWILAKKPKKPVVWVEPVVDHESQTITYEIREGGNPPEGNVGRQGGTCIATGAPIPFAYIRSEAQAGRMGEVLLAVVAEGTKGRRYAEAPTDRIEIPASNNPPAGDIFDWPGRMNVVRYGLDEWEKLFAPRQMVALTTFSDLLVEMRAKVKTDAIAAGFVDDDVRLRDGGTGADAYADALTTYLAFVVDKCADYWSSISSWNVPREQIRNTFGRQAIPMTWDFAETNPFSSSSGNWGSMLKWVTKVITELPTNNIGQTVQRDARARIAEVGELMLTTDPPYYDNISYADLSDFFYVWMRRNLADVWPDEMATLATPKADELIANQYRAGSKKAAHEHFESGMLEVFGAAAANADRRFPAAIYYAFKATESGSEGVTSTGWETFLAGVLESGWAITATWPVRTEKPGRTISLGTNALATSVVLACRRREIAAPMATRSEFLTALRTELEPAVHLLQQGNIAPVDMAQSAIGPGIAVFSRYSKVVEADGSPMTVRAALGLINEVLDEVLSGEESEFDAQTRFAITWFEQYGHNPAPFGDADNLARARNTSVDTVQHAGLLESRGGKVRLLERSELADGWDPTTDSTLTVWETTQYLIRALERSESEAAELLAKAGTEYGERARQLSYLLYGIADKKKWAEEASAYNMLVTAWPEIARLSKEAGTAGQLF